MDEKLKENGVQIKFLKICMVIPDLERGYEVL